MMMTMITMTTSAVLVSRQDLLSLAHLQAAATAVSVVSKNFTYGTHSTVQAIKLSLPCFRETISPDSGRTGRLEDIGPIRIIRLREEDADERLCRSESPSAACYRLSSRTKGMGLTTNDRVQFHDQCLGHARTLILLFTRVTTDNNACDQNQGSKSCCW